MLLWPITTRPVVYETLRFLHGIEPVDHRFMFDDVELRETLAQPAMLVN